MTVPQGSTDEAMTDSFAASDEAAQTDGDDDTGSSSRAERSSIKFPYTDLKDAARVPATIKNNFGSACDIDQLAGQFGQSVSSGTFRTRIAAAVAFGLVVSRKKRISVTALGHSVAAGDRASLATAFLNVELYKRVYEEYRGKTLPEDPGLTSEINNYGVVATQADRARQVMQRSAEYAGFFHAGRDKLIMPPTGTVASDDGQSAALVAAPQQATPTTSSGGGGGSMADNPILRGLWGMLPPDGDFPAEKRAQWFKALAVNLDLVYGNSNLDIQVISPNTAERQGQTPQHGN